MSGYMLKGGIVATRYEQRCAKKVMQLEAELFTKVLDGFHSVLTEQCREHAFWAKMYHIRIEYISRLEKLK